MSAPTSAHVYPAGHGQWAFVAGTRSGTGYPSKAAARDAAATAIQAQTADVDVLAVIRRHAESHRSAAASDAYSAQEAPRLEAAFAAVAELIEADDEYDEAWRSMAGRTNTAARREAAGLRRAAALARAKGGAA